jgi:hypothetical protein
MMGDADVGTGEAVEPERPPLTRSDETSWWVGLAVLAIVVALLALGGRAVLRMSAGERLGVVVFVVVVGAAAFLVNRYEVVEVGASRAFVAYFTGLAWLFAALAPVWVAYSAGVLIQEQLPGWLQAVALLVYGGLLAWGLRSVSTPRRRERLFARLENIGPSAPWVYAVDLVIVAAVFFGTVTFVLHEREVVELVAAEAEVTGGRAVDLYLWHFSEAIPLLRVTETTGWTRPLEHDHAVVGWLLLTFKVAVILPLIAAFRGYWKHVRDRDAEPATS